MPLENKDSFLHGNLTVRWRSVSLPIKFRIVRLIFLEYVVNSRQEHSSNGDDCFLVATAFLESKVAIADFWEFFGTNRIEGALNKVETL